MLKRSVEESREKYAAVRSGVQYSDRKVRRTVNVAACVRCIVYISLRGHHFGGLSGIAPPSAPTGVRTLATGEPLHWKHRS